MNSESPCQHDAGKEIRVKRARAQEQLQKRRSYKSQGLLPSNTTGVHENTKKGTVTSDARFVVVMVALTKYLCLGVAFND